MSVLIVTSVGDVVVDLHTDRCPLTCKNFLKLCKMKYYNGCLFHKVEKDFLAQTGDPTGTGTGGESVYRFLYGDQARFFDDEIHPDLKHSKTGTVAMVSAGQNCNASQLYFTLRDEIDYLDGKHTIFGMVEEKEGLDTLAKINEAYVDDKGRPFKDIRIKHTYILDDPFDDPPQLAEFIPEQSPEGKPQHEIAEERLQDDWIPLDETLGEAELEELMRTKESHTNATILETIGDIPDADIKPPDNVLFVCKLNPATEDEDLHTIFSRFGNVTSAEIIRDYKTGNSLGYAFIEFETKEACERAYFKMDNTLIDDRRIHVDFSQSVAKLWGKYRHGTRHHASKGGCFKCGATDHIAKDCDEGPNSKPKGPSYVLKNDDTQHGGDNLGYEMLFDGHDLVGSEEARAKKKPKTDHRGGESAESRGHDKRSERQRHDDDDDDDDDERKGHRERPYRDRRYGDGDLRRDGREPVDRRKHDHDDYDRRRRERDGRSRGSKGVDENYPRDNGARERVAEKNEDREHLKRHESGRHRDHGDYRSSTISRSGKEGSDGDKHAKDASDHERRSKDGDHQRKYDGYHGSSRSLDVDARKERRHRNDRRK